MTRALTAIGLSTVGAALIALALPTFWIVTDQMATNEPERSPLRPAPNVGAKSDQAGMRVILASPYAQDAVVDRSKLRSPRPEQSAKPGASELVKQVEPSPKAAERSKQATAVEQGASAAEQLAMRQPADPQRLNAGDAKQSASTAQQVSDHGKPPVEQARLAAEGSNPEVAPKQDIDSHPTGGIEKEHEVGQSRGRRAEPAATRGKSARQAAADERRRSRQIARQGDQMARQGGEATREPRVGDLVDEHLLRDAPTVSRQDVAEGRSWRRTREPKVGDLVDAKMLENAPLLSGGRLLQ
jgi:hypothetical protein